MKTQLELVMNDDGRMFLNFWNYYNGDDVVCEIKNGELIDNNGDGVPITLQEFTDRVRLKLQQQQDES